MLHVTKPIAHVTNSVTTFWESVTSFCGKPGKRGFLRGQSVTSLVTHVTILVTLVTFLAACTTTKSSHCTAFEATPPSNAQIDAMTPDEKARVLAELLKFERICGVKL